MNDINKRLCELLGCDVPRPKDTCPLCGKTNTDGKFIDGADFFSEKGRIDLLKRMRKREDWPEFYVLIHERYFKLGNGIAPVSVWKKFMAAHARDKGASIPIEMILDNTGALARAALEFLEGKK